MTKREAELKSAFTREMTRQLPEFIMLFLATAGAPDRSITGMGRTTHFEFKHGTPGFVSPGNQELMCMRLAEHGFCRYVVWQESHAGVQRTLIVHPRFVHDRTLIAEESCQDFNHLFVVDYIRRVHEHRR